MFGAVALAFDFDGMCIDQLRMRLQQGHAAVHQDAAIDAVQALNLAILVGDQGLPVEGRAVDGPAVALRPADVLSVVRTVDQQLLRHTADVDAGAAGSGSRRRPLSRQSLQRSAPHVRHRNPHR